MIRILYIPADRSRLMELRTVNASLKTFQELVGGYIEALTLENPLATMYLNETGKLQDLPQNKRATVLLWTHRPEFVGQDYIAGDAFICGPPDSHGNDTDVPAVYEELVQHGPA